MGGIWYWLLWWVVFGASWLLLVYQADLVNVIAGAIVGGFTTLGAMVAWRTAKAEFAVPRGWAGAFASLPLKLFTDSWLLLVALYGRIIRRDPCQGELIHIPFDHSHDTPETAARTALVLYGVSLTPNTLAITVEQDSILIHQLVSPSQPQRRDPKWPV